jgi:two-component system chemotaxis sensor kinase CheA
VPLAGRDDAAPAKRSRAGTKDPERLVPVGLDRLDGLVRLSGEAVAAGLRLTHLLQEHIDGDVAAEAAALELRRALTGVQQQTMRTRMTSLEGIATTLRRAARDVARASGKEVDYGLEGERVELDRAVLDGLRDPLLHLVRNAVDHGLEGPDLREARGKPRTGVVRVLAARRGPEITIAVSDDGRGLDLARLREKAEEPGLDDRDAAQLVFRPGLSTAGAVTDISGRGVGLDAVRTAVEALRGRVDVTSEPGRGCRFTVTVPLTLAVLPCVLLEVAGTRYHLPTHATRTISEDGHGAEVGLEGGRALWVGGEVVPVSSLAGALGLPEGRADGPALVLEGTGGQRHAFRVDAVLGQRDVTVKELGAVAPRTQLVAGASIEADGSVVLVLDPTALVEGANRRRRAASPVVRAPQAAAAATAATAEPGPARVLVVDDALTVRELQRSILERAGYVVRVAVDGEDALARLAEERPDLVISDVEMPRLDGCGLVRAIRGSAGLESLPVLMVTSKASEEDRRRGLDAGADAYIVKQDFDAQRLLAAVERLLGG